MTIFFCCTSVFHIFVTYILSLTSYRDAKYKKVIILDIHLDNIRLLYPNIKCSGVWDRIVLIERTNKSQLEIFNQFQELRFQPDDTFHCFGVDNLTSAFLESVPFGGNAIYTEEGYSTGNLDSFFSKLQKDHPDLGFRIPFENVKEIWMFNSKMSTNNLNIPVKDIEFLEYLNDNKFKEQFLAGLKKIFLPDCDNFNLSMDNLYFFDQYLSTASKISFEAEQYILKRISELSKWVKLIVKPHPGENHIDLNRKYNDLTLELLLYHSVPWEVLYLLGDNVYNPNEKIFITYNSTSLLNQRILFNDNKSHLIFLNKILDRYYQHKTDMFHVDKFISVYGSDNLYFPESFAELYEIVCNIKKINYNSSNINSLLLKEYHEELQWLRNSYSKNWRTNPNPNNITTLFYDFGKGFELYQEINVYIDESCEDFDFTFDIPTEIVSSLKEVKWYAVRGRNVKIKIDRILYTNLDDVIQDVDLPHLTYLGVQDERRYIKCDGFDPCFFISIPESIRQIQIIGKWEFDNSYHGAVVAANVMAGNLANRLEAAIAEKDVLHSEYVSNQKSIEIMESQISTDKLGIEKLEHQINEYKQKMGDLENQILYDKEKIKSMEIESLSDKQNLGNMEIKLELTIGQVNELKEMISSITDKNQQDKTHYLNQIEALKRVISSYENSMSWKLTKFFRLIKKLFNNQ